MKYTARQARSLAVALAAVALTTIPAPSLAEVPPAAQPAFNKGVLAAKQQDWRLAEIRFQEARRSAPDAPELLYNLGLTESKMPGRELRAIAWFGAYLAANPTATNAIAVNSLIDQLQVKSESNIVQLITTMQKAASQLPSMGDPPRNDGLAGVADAWGFFGDFDAAQSVIDLIDNSGDQSNPKKLLASYRDGTALSIAMINSAPPTKPTKMCDWAVLVDAEAHNNGQWCWEQRRFTNDLASEPGPLNSAVFLDFAGYLNALPTKGNSIAALHNAAYDLIKAEKVISRMVLRQRAAGQLGAKK